MDAREIRQSRWYRVLITVGLVSYGLVHLIVTWIAVQVAFGKKGDASQQGAFKQLATNPLGVALLWVMAVGLVFLLVWQLLVAVIGREVKTNLEGLKERGRAIGRGIVYLALGILAARSALGSGSQSGKGEETLSARLMAVPFGRVLVGAIGLVVIAVGVSQIVKGVRKKFATQDLRGGASEATLRLGTVGYVAKGIALAIVGALFGWAAIAYDAKKAGGMDAALTAVRDQPFGPILLVIMALGIACFGLFCFAWARQPKL